MGYRDLEEVGLMSIEQDVFQVREFGKLTVVGFPGVVSLNEFNVALCRDRLASLIAERHCEVVAFDLRGIQSISSVVLGFFASLRKYGVEVRLYDPTQKVREILELTKFDQIMRIDRRADELD
jgi:anti-sigma B factor antagonist